MTPTSSVPQGTMRMWVDILTMAEASKFPMVRVRQSSPVIPHSTMIFVVWRLSQHLSVQVNVVKPPPVPYEVRLIVWRTKNVVAMDKVWPLPVMWAAF